MKQAWFYKNSNMHEDNYMRVPCLPDRLASDLRKSNFLRMKSLKFLVLFVLAFTITVSSCKKDEETQSKKEMLTANSWQLSSIIENGITNVLHDCDKDNILTFLSNGTYTKDPNAIRCEFGDIIESGTWTFSIDEKFLNLDDGTQMNIVELSKNKLVLLEVGNVNNYLVTLIAI